LQKPFTQQQLREMIEIALNTWWYALMVILISKNALK
jgi:hypothetical protein